MPVTIGRRKLIAALGGAAAAWPLAARAQQRERVPRVGVLFNLPPDDQEAQKALGLEVPPNLLARADEVRVSISLVSAPKEGRGFAHRCPQSCTSSLG